MTAEQLKTIADIIHASGARLHSNDLRAARSLSPTCVSGIVYAVTAERNAERLISALERGGFRAEIRLLPGDAKARHIIIDLAGVTSW